MKIPTETFIVLFHIEFGINLYYYYSIKKQKITKLFQQHFTFIRMTILAVRTRKTINRADPRFEKCLLHF